MFRNFIQGILFMCIIVILPILASFIVEAITSIVTMEMVMKMVYVALGILAIYFVKVGVE